MSMFGLPPKQWRGIVRGVAPLHFPLERFPGQASWPALRNGIRGLPDGIDEHSSSVARLSDGPDHGDEDVGS